MKVVGINGSPRSKGNTGILINHVFKELEQEGIETELVQLGGRKIRGCLSCYKCFQNRDCRCSNDNDVLNEILGKMVEADGIILGSPTYFSSMTAEMKALIDRCGPDLSEIRCHLIAGQCGHLHRPCGLKRERRLPMLKSAGLCRVLFSLSYAQNEHN